MRIEERERRRAELAVGLHPRVPCRRTGPRSRATPRSLDVRPLQAGDRACGAATDPLTPRPSRPTARVQLAETRCGRGCKRTCVSQLRASDPRSAIAAMRRPATLAGTSVAAITSFGAMSHLAGGHALPAKARLANRPGSGCTMSQHSSAICRDFVGMDARPCSIRLLPVCCPRFIADA